MRELLKRLECARLLGGAKRAHQDPVTKSQRLTDTQGQVIAAIDLDAWGGETSKSWQSQVQPRKYTTYDRDGSGNDQAMMRQYHGYYMRFDQPDPYAGSMSLADPQSLNRYSYVQNDPVNFVDPSGLNPAGPGTSYGSGILWTMWLKNENGLYSFVRQWFEPYGSGGSVDGGESSQESDLQRGQREWQDKFSSIYKQFQQCDANVAAEKQKQFNERIGATAGERLAKVYKGVLPDFNSIGAGGLGALANHLAKKPWLGGFAQGLAAEAAFKTLRNSAPLLLEMAKINLEGQRKHAECVHERNNQLNQLGSPPRR